MHGTKADRGQGRNIPVAILIAVYAGLKLFGLGGIFLGPIGLVMIQQVYGAYIRYIDGASQMDYDENS